MGIERSTPYTVRVQGDDKVLGLHLPNDLTHVRPFRPRYPRRPRILSHHENSSRVQDIVRIEHSLERTHGFDFLPCPTHLQIGPLNYADAVFR